MSANLFDSLNLEKVREFLRQRPLGLAVDVDGTLSEIVAVPEEAAVDEGCKYALSMLVRRLDLVAAISGRSVATTRAMVGVEGILYFGVHGLERWESGVAKALPAAARYRPAIQASLAAVAKALTDDPATAGIIVENKDIAVSIHYRNAPQSEAARRAILRAIKQSGAAAGLKIVEGKKVIEICPPVRFDKGDAVQELVAGYSLAGMIYVGDDLTDIDAFTALRTLREQRGIGTLAIGVLGPETPLQIPANADLVVCGVGEVEKFLKWLAQEL